VSLRAVGKKTLESLSLAGAFDALHGDNRAAYFYSEMPGKATFLESIVKYGQNVQEGKGSTANSLFGDSVNEISVPEPVFPIVEPWHVLELLEREKEVVGIYLSGHPLDDYKREMENFIPFSEMGDLKKFEGKSELRSGGIITRVVHKLTKKGKPFGSFAIEDFSGSREFLLFSEDYLKLKHFLEPNRMVYLNWRTNKDYRNEEELEVKINNLGILADLKDKYTQLTITIPETDLNESFITELSDLLSRHPGKCKLKVNLSSPDPLLNLSLFSSSVKIDANSELLRDIGRLVGERFSLN